MLENNTVTATEIWPWISYVNLCGILQSSYAGSSMALVLDDGQTMTHLRYHTLEGLHNFGALRLLIVGETARHDYDGCQHNAQVKLCEEIESATESEWVTN